MADTPEKKRLLPEPNLALWDRLARAVVASAIAIAWYEGYIPADIAMAALIIAGALFVNGLMGKCWLYGMLGISTCKIKPPKHAKK